LRSKSGLLVLPTKKEKKSQKKKKKKKDVDVAKRGKFLDYMRDEVDLWFFGLEKEGGVGKGSSRKGFDRISRVFVFEDRDKT